MPAWLLAIVLWFIGLAGLDELPADGQCIAVPGPSFITTVEEHRPMCVDSFGTMREQG